MHWNNKKLRSHYQTTPQQNPPRSLLKRSAGSLYIVVRDGNSTPPADRRQTLINNERKPTLQHAILAEVFALVGPSLW